MVRMFYVTGNNFYNPFNLLDIPVYNKTNDLYHKKRLVFYDSLNIPIDERNRLLDIIAKRKKQKLQSEIVYEYSHEAGIGDNDLIEYVDLLKSRNIPLGNVKFILNLDQKYIDKRLKISSLQIYSVDFFSVSTLRHIQAGINQYTTKHLAHRDPRINFLAAQLFHKTSRLDALYLLFKKGLIQDAIKGILITTDQLDEHRRKINDNSFYIWLSNNLGPADNVKVFKDENTGGYTACNGNPYSVHIYDQSRVSYICETNCEVHPTPDTFITEKTYRPIINGSPFVLQGSYGQLDFLESIGINTYQKYTGRRYNEGSKSSYVESVVDAAQELLQATMKYPYDLDNIARHNQNRLIDYANKQLKDIKAFLGVPNE